FPASATGVSSVAAPRLPADPVYVVKAGDTLWDLAAAHLGNPHRWVELFDMNRGRAEPGGSLSNPNLIYSGWTLTFPANAPGFASQALSTRSVASQGPGNGTTTTVASCMVSGGQPAGLCAHTTGGPNGWSI